MCIAWPMRVAELLDTGDCLAELDGVTRKISLRLLDGIQPGDYILVHAGYAIEKIDTQAAEEQLETMNELKKNFSL